MSAKHGSDRDGCMKVQAKKSGAGKGGWGKVMDSSMPDHVDPADPNYDPEE